MATRGHQREIEVQAPPEQVFAALLTPSAVRAWWFAARVIILPEPGGLWVAAWGEDEDSPEYVSAAVIEALEAPRTLRLGQFRYHAREGNLPFAADLHVEFTVSPAPGGARLRVVQDGFPLDAAADDFYAACERGWEATLASFRRFIG